MPTVLTPAKRLFHRARGMVHPFIESFAPVTYTDREVITRKRQLDPTAARNDPRENVDTDRRVRRLARALGFSQATALRYLDEARKIQLVPTSGGPDTDLASPMCYEDRYSLYVIVRAAKPEIVVETGVAHGASSAYILAAMHASGAGRLISIEVSEDRRVGHMVAPELRDRWSLCIGDSRALLPEILDETGYIDLFIHDSNHTYNHMWAEFTTAWPHLSPGGLLCSHDVLMANALPRFARRHRKDIENSVNGVNFGWVRKRTATQRCRPTTCLNEYPHALAV